MDYPTLAAIIDSKGILILQRLTTAGKAYLEAHLVINDQEKKFLEEIKEFIGKGGVYEERNHFTYKLTHQETFKKVLEEVIPYLDQKAVQAELILEFLHLRTSGKNYTNREWQLYYSLKKQQKLEVETFTFEIDKKILESKKESLRRRLKEKGFYDETFDDDLIDETIRSWFYIKQLAEMIDQTDDLRLRARLMRQRQWELNYFYRGLENLGITRAKRIAEKEPETPVEDAILEVFGEGK